MRLVRPLVLALVAAAPLGVSAMVAPHDPSQTVGGAVDCEACHVGHVAGTTGPSLTKAAANFGLCQSCHATASRPGVATWDPIQQGSVNGGLTSGFSHSWSGAATNTTIGATIPNAASSDPGEKAMAARLVNGAMQCSTCHDQHGANTYKGTQYVSPITINLAGGGTGTMTLAAVLPTAAGKGYRVQIVASGLFKVSNDGGASWWGCNPSNSYTTYFAAVAPPSTALGCTTTANIQLNDGANVKVNLSSSASSYHAGDRWDFYVGYPFLRADNTDGKMCIICHKNRNQSARNVEGLDPIVGTGQAIVFGTTVFSHPVNQALSQPYDRTVGTNGLLLDADGSTTGDGKATNNLVLGTAGIVTCMTCHHPHNADSNALTEDAR